MTPSSQVQLVEECIEAKMLSGTRVKFVSVELYEQLVEGSSYNPQLAGSVGEKQLAISSAVLLPPCFGD